MGKNIEKKNKTYLENGLKHLYAPPRLWDLVDKLSKATGETKMKIIEEGVMRYAESKVSNNPIYKKGKELIAEVDNNQKEMITILKQILSRQNEHTDAERTLWAEVEKLRKEMTKYGKK